MSSLTTIEWTRATDGSAGATWNPGLGRTALVMPLLGGCVSTCDLAPHVRALAGEAER